MTLKYSRDQRRDELLLYIIEGVGVLPSYTAPAINGIHIYKLFPVVTGDCLQDLIRAQAEDKVNTYVIDNLYPAQAVKINGFKGFHISQGVDYPPDSGRVRDGDQVINKWIQTRGDCVLMR